MIVEVASPVLQSNVPVAFVDKVDVPLQLSVTLTEGAVGVVFGDAVPDPAALVQPLTVVVTVYVPEVFTVIVEVFAPVLHNNVPVALVDKVEVPSQLSVTLTDGAAGVVFGDAIPDPAKLVQPLAVLVTVYVPALFTVIN